VAGQICDGVQEIELPRQRAINPRAVALERARHELRVFTQREASQEHGDDGGWKPPPVACEDASRDTCPDDHQCDE
jgi:hypothetical protein